MPVTWNDRQDVRLFINVLKVHSVKLDYAALAAAMGQGVTGKAISHRIAKLRSIAASEEAFPSGPAPTSRKPRAKPLAGKKRAAKALLSDDAQEDDEGAEGVSGSDHGGGPVRTPQRVKLEPKSRRAKSGDVQQETSGDASGEVVLSSGAEAYGSEDDVRVIS
ncbi:MAG: hypothetical protein M1832_001271 [Thelocarpon impressellum]|nr:MAG: hypothetical protein M1832_001271 [Thelocarpon impressellum]